MFISTFASYCQIKIEWTDMMKNNNKIVLPVLFDIVSMINKLILQMYVLVSCILFLTSPSWEADWPLETLWAGSYLFSRR